MSGRRTLVVVGQAGVMLVPLPWKGSQLFVGRDSFCEVCLEGEQVSRQHARLTRDRAAGEAAPTMLADLGSRNGTTVDGRRVEPESPVPLDEGAVVRIGDAMLVIEDRRGPARLELVAGVGAVARRVDDEIARAASEGVGFALVEVRVEGGEGRLGTPSSRRPGSGPDAPLFYAWQAGQYLTADAEQVITTSLRDGDVLAALGEGVWLALLPAATPARSRQIGARLRLWLDEAGFKPRVRLALFPEQGATADALLLALASPSAAGEPGEGELPELRPEGEALPLGAGASADLAASLVARACAAMQLSEAPRLSPQALAWLEADGWLGEVRELEAVLERAVVLCEGPSITLEHLPLKRWRQTGLQASTPRLETVDFGPGGFGAGPGSRPEPYGQL